jgi:hypothetical protein
VSMPTDATYAPGQHHCRHLPNSHAVRHAERGAPPFRTPLFPAGWREIRDQTACSRYYKDRARDVRCPRKCRWRSTL